MASLVLAHAAPDSWVLRSPELTHATTQEQIVTDRLAIESLGFIPRFIPQPAVLAMLTAQSRQHPSFQLHMGTAVRDLIRAGDRVVGVQADGSDGPRELAADLVIGTDGRYSTVRKRGAFTEPRSPQHFDVR
jgi:2-polyprenyl-6-methoxyphenol hydroxylase-like FAD-dependent oxidoreductase